MAELERHCFTLRVREGMEAEYRRVHDEVWPDLVAALRDAGIGNYSLFMRGRDVIGCFERDPQAARLTLEQLDELEISRRWDERMQEIIESFGETPREVWHI